ncbi:outer membrane beta-barrel family protein [Bacteroidota bacterium]
MKRFALTQMAIPFLILMVFSRQTTKQHPAIRIFLIFFLSHIFGTTLLSQSVVKGTVTDESGNLPEYANVLLLQSSDSSLIKGSILSPEGKYSFEDVGPGDYIVTTSMIGYRPSYSELLHIRPGNNEILVPVLILVEDATQLEEVTIKKKKPLYVQKIDRLEVNVQSSATMAGNTALEILEKSPGVLVDRQNSTLNLRGKSGVRVMINGKRTRMPMSAVFGMLEGMPSSNIDKVELITTPPANFDAEGDAGFINIVLIKNDYEGLNGTLSATLGYGRQERIMAGGNFNYRKKKINIYGNYNFNHRNGIQYFDMSRTNQRPEYTLETETSLVRDYMVNLNTGRVGLDYYLTENTVVGLLGTYYDRNWSQVQDEDVLFLLEPGLDTSCVSIRNEQTNSNHYLGNFNLQHKINSHHLLNFDVDYIRTYSHQPQDYLVTFLLEGGQEIRSEELTIDKKTPLDIWVGKADYTFTLNKKLKFESGIKGAMSNLTNNILAENFIDGSWMKNNNFSVDAHMKEIIQAAYGSMDYSINDKTAMKAGLRYEHTFMELGTDTSGTDLTRNFANLFPTLFLSRQFNENNNLVLTYYKRITRPGFNDLAPWVILMGPTTYFTGNIDLLPAISSSVKADYSFKKLLVSLQYTRIKNSIQRFQPIQSPDSDLLLVTTINMDKEDLYSLSASFPIKIASWWTMQNNVNAYITNLESIYTGTPIEINHMKFDAKSSQIFELPKDYSFQLSFQYFSKAQRGILRNNSRELLNFGFLKKFKDNLGTLSLSISNILNEPWFDVEYNIPELGLQGRSFTDMDSRFVSLTYSRQFGDKKLKSRYKRQTGSGDIQRRLED